MLGLRLNLGSHSVGLSVGKMESEYFRSFVHYLADASFCYTENSLYLLEHCDLRSLSEQAMF